jgi:hypothetical protein
MSQTFEPKAAKPAELVASFTGTGFVVQVSLVTGDEAKTTDLQLSVEQPSKTST